MNPDSRQFYDMICSKFWQWIFYNSYKAGYNDFNRGMLFNIGYTMSMNLTNNFWRCFIFHDVDLLPEDDRSLYTCPELPRHMSVGNDTWLTTD